MDQPFVLFGTAHIAAIVLAFAVPVILAVAVRMSGNAALANAIRWAFAVELIATYALWYWLLFARGWFGIGSALPMHLCDWPRSRPSSRSCGRTREATSSPISGR